MKRIALVLFLTILMVSGIASPVLAADPLNVDIVIIGDDPNVGVVVDGDNARIGILAPDGSIVYVNGQDIASLVQTTYIAIVSPEGQIALKEIKENINPWLEALEGRLGLTMDGLAKIIIMTQSQEEKLSKLAGDIEGISKELDSLDVAFYRQSIDLSALRTKISNLEAKGDAERGQLSGKIKSIEGDNKTQEYYLVGLSVLSCLLVIGLVAVVVKLRRG